MPFLSPPAIFVLIGGATALLYYFYKKALPQPIPGIPHNHGSEKRILGDMPGMISAVLKTEQIFPWMTSQNIKLNSPIIQLFCRPLQKPWVVITDFRESQDILLRRTREFDRSDFLGDVFIGLTPDMHISMKSYEERFKQHRNLLKDLMTLGFLNEVAAPQIYSSVETLLDLWNLKSKLADGHPFEAYQDIYSATLDFIFAATFGLDPEDSMTSAQRQLLMSNPDIDLPRKFDEPVEFLTATRPPVFEAILTLTESLETTVKSPLPRLHHDLLRQMPYMRKARAVKEAFITTEIEKRVARFESGDTVKRSALDDVLQRELNAAKKEGRIPNLKSRAIYDELFGFLIGGHDTTSTTMAWAVKHLASTPAAQDSLRTHLRKAYADATQEKRNPTVNEITRTPVPYLDAAIEEILRTAVVFPGVIRNATTDAVVLGHRIPKGTDLFLFHGGPGYFSTPFDIPDSLRTKSALEAKNQVRSWDPATMKEFMPERWLARDEEGNIVFDSMAGPHLAFGLGPRACYGRRLAYLELRISLVMLVWNFEFLQCPEELSKWAAVDKLTRTPKCCYVRLRKAGW